MAPHNTNFNGQTAGFIPRSVWSDMTEVSSFCGFWWRQASMRVHADVWIAQMPHPQTSGFVWPTVHEPHTKNTTELVLNRHLNDHPFVRSQPTKEKFYWLAFTTKGHKPPLHSCPGLNTCRMNHDQTTLSCVTRAKPCNKTGSVPCFSTTQN